MGAITVECDTFNPRTSEHLTIIKRINVINSIDGGERRFQKENYAFWGVWFLLLIQQKHAFWAQICAGTYKGTEPFSKYFSNKVKNVSWMM